MTFKKDGSPIMKPYTTKELAELYKVSIPTFQKWLLKFKDELEEKRGWYWSIRQVKYIFERLGMPEENK